MNFIKWFIYLIKIINEIHSYEIIHLCIWIKITLNFKFQAQSSKLKFHAHAQTILMHVGDTNVAIVSSMEWLWQNQLQDCNTTMILHKIMFNIWAPPLDFSCLHFNI